MTFDVTPESVRSAHFRTAFRGLDRTEVESLLDAVATRIQELDNERRELVSKLEEQPGHDLETEFETLGREISAILQSAREAAQSMRERASLDAARWRREAMEEADTTLREAVADAEALRRDAWVTGTELLEQTGAATDAMRANAERDVLTIMGEAEREAHRLTSGARREAEDLVRNATMEAEKITADAVSRRDEIIDGANRQAATAQERTRALEQRRDELLEELENVRSTLTRLEGSLEERREALDLTATEPSSVKVVQPPSESQRQWELGETVRVVPADDRQPSEPDSAIADEMSQEVARIQEPEIASEPPPPSEPEPEPEPQSEASQPESTVADDVGALFASLRTSGLATHPAEKTPAEPADDEQADADEGTDWIAEREALLLPIANRALRGIKKAMTEVQNVALDSLRTDEQWEPDEEAIAEEVRAELISVWSESFAAGHSVAERMTGTKLKRPKTPASRADEKFAADLAAAVSLALNRSGGGFRDRQSAASRVFRVWRTDEAERRIRDLALEGYESGIEESRKVTAEA